jgi:hypothetical protein
VAIDTDTFFVNATSNNVGIGTTTPSSKLHIQESTGANIILNSNTGEVSNGVYMTEGSSSTPMTNGAYLYYNGSTNKFNIATGAGTLTDRLTIVRDTGNVGINTSSPVSLLDIKTSAGFNRGIRIGPQTTTSGDGAYIEFADSTTDGYGPKIGGIREISSAYGALVFYTGANEGTETMRLNRYGYLGINTTSPQNTLNVVGDLNVTGNAYLGSLTWNGDLDLNTNDILDATNINATRFYEGGNRLALNSSLDNYLLKSQWNATNTSYYLASNPFAFYNSTSLTQTVVKALGFYNTSQVFNTTQILGFNYYNSTTLNNNNQLANGNNYWNSTFATFNKTYADTLYLLNTGDTATGNYTFDTSTLHIDSSGDKIGIGTISPEAKLDVEGTTGGGLAIIGRNTATGNQSIAMGYNTTASGNFSTAMGESTIASGNFSTAMGESTIASGNFSTAMGLLTTASGNFSTAMGYYTTASGEYSTAMGLLTTASGEYSTAMGYYTTASGKYSTAMGLLTTASGNFSTAMGYYTTASGEYSTAMGEFTIASGRSATAMGRDTNASGEYSTAMGNRINVSGTNSFGIGLNSTAYTLSQANTMAIMGGNVGIGTVTPSVALEVTGNIEYTGELVDVSDIRLKENIVPLNNSLNKILNLSAFSYNLINNSEIEYGLSAQEVQKVFPEVVNIIDNEKGYLGISYPLLIPVIIQSIQELKSEKDNEIANLKETINSQNNTINEMKQSLCELGITKWC